MSSQTFFFKQFSVKQDKCAMKVSTDAVLLGAWVDADNLKNILDIGTGTGIIALMLAQRSAALIDAIDIDENACIQAKENSEASKWKKQISIHHDSFQNFITITQDQYSLIISNPPYFVDSSKSPEEARSKARHTDTLSFNELIEGAKKLLLPEGKFCLILPLKEGEAFIGTAEKKGFFLTKLTRVKTTNEKTEKRLLMQFEFIKKPLSENSIVIEKDERHSYTDEYKALTKDYYLGF